MADSIDNSQDIIDSRDVIARIEALESELQDALTGSRATARPKKYEGFGNT